MGVHYKQVTGRVPSINDPLVHRDAKPDFSTFISTTKIDRVQNETCPKVSARVRKYDTIKPA